MKKCIQPIIIIGMHRSGTTMISKMLRQLGLFVGWNYNAEYEANFFLQRNETILNHCGGNWTNPLIIENLLSNDKIVEQVSRVLSKDMSSLSFIDFLGTLKYLKYRNYKNLNFAWGWKDPRNTFTLPIWLQIFKDAKVIHIYRNGLDVAQSLMVREKKRIKSLANQDKTINEHIDNQFKQLNSQSAILYLKRKIENRIEKTSSLFKYYKFRINPCISIEKGYELWEHYVDRAFRHVESINNPSLSIRYEDFLVDPTKYLNQLVDFCDLKTDTSKVEEVSAQINSNRRFAFRENDKLLKFYNEKKTSYWMKRLGYDADF